MASLNQVTILGRVSRDIELKHLPSGSAVCEIGLAVNDKYKGKDGQWVEKTVWVDVSCFGRTAELASEYLRKGSETLIAGKLALDEWTDKSSGQKRTKLKVVAKSVQFLGSREPSGERNAAPRRPAADDFGGKPQMPPGEDLPQDDEVPF